MAFFAAFFFGLAFAFLAGFFLAFLAGFLAFFFAVFLGAAFFRAGFGAGFAAGFTFETDCWDVHEALRSADPGFVLLDVRAPELYASGHIAGAVSLPSIAATAIPFVQSTINGQPICRVVTPFVIMVTL